MGEAVQKILFATRFPEALRERLQALPGRPAVIGPFAPHQAPGQALDPAEAAQVRALVTMGTLPTRAALLDRLPGLKLISCFGSGYEGVDVAEAARRGILVTHSPAVNAGSVAEQAMGLLLAVSRQIVRADRYVREGGWETEARMPVLRGLEGQRLGIYGYGAIGARIAAMAAGFGMEIAYHGRSAKPGAPYPFHPTLAGLAGWADVLMVAVRANERNRGAVDEKVLRALGPEGILVNVARGSAVDEAALIRLLEAGALAGAGLDVFENEPVVPPALKASPRVVLAPHMGGGTVQAFEAMQDLVVRNLAAFFGEGRVLTPVPELAR